MVEQHRGGAIGREARRGAMEAITKAESWPSGGSENAKVVSACTPSSCAAET